MSTTYHRQYEQDTQANLHAEGMKVGIVVSQWNASITDALLQGALDALKLHGVRDEDILLMRVPGSFELTYGAARMMRCTDVDAVITLGSVVRGDTPHFDYVCQGVTQGVAQLNTEGSVPVIFGVLTTDNMQQAEERAGGKLGNKGEECAITAIKMAKFSCELKK